MRPGCHARVRMVPDRLGMECVMTREAVGDSARRLTDAETVADRIAAVGGVVSILCLMGPGIAAPPMNPSCCPAS